MHERIAEIEARFEELTELLSDPEVVSDHRRMAELARERSRLEPIVDLGRRFRETGEALADAHDLLRSGDEDERELAREEEERLTPLLADIEEDLKLALLPRDPADEKNAIIEIRAGAGGEEAALFAADLFRMYQRYAERHGWRLEVLNTSEAGPGGYREMTFELSGRDAYRRMKHESGVHRVQRVPETESQGRIHTSTATVAVLPEVDEVEVDIDWSEVRTDIFHASSAGGQNVNKVATAVRFTHEPTGIVVICQDERSQAKKPREGGERVARAHLRPGARESRRRGRRRAPLAGRQRRPLGEDPHLQLPRRPRHRPSSAAHQARPPAHPRRRDRRADRRGGDGGAVAAPPAATAAPTGLTGASMALSGRPEQADQQHDPGGTVGALLLQAARGLVAIWAAESLDEGRLEADLLYGEAAGLSRAQVIAAGRERPPPEARSRFDALLRRRMAREPLAYILGRREFHGLTFEVGPGALIPRPETETLAEASLAAIREHPSARRIVRIADAGTGSGAVALAIARHAPSAKIFATDASTEALAWAGRNRARLGLMERVVLLAGDLLEPIGEPLDVVAANLPYIPTEEYERLPAEIRRRRAPPGRRRRRGRPRAGPAARRPAPGPPRGRPGRRAARTRRRPVRPRRRLGHGGPRWWGGDGASGSGREPAGAGGAAGVLRVPACLSSPRGGAKIVLCRYRSTL